MGYGVKFYLGTHQPGWLSTAGVPLFVSDRRIRRYKQLPRAVSAWALDSGGFTELSQYGTWDHGPTPGQYVDRVRRYRDEVGRLDWAAPQDWMCEPWILAKTGLTVAEHQRRTIDNYLELTRLDHGLPFVPVVQGYRLDDYLTHVDLYRGAGVDLTTLPLVGVGSVCRRQGTGEVERIFATLAAAGVTRMHGFGLKKLGLVRSGHWLASADSMAWSYDARRSPRLDGCHGHKNCANCPRYALRWRTELLAAADRVVVEPTLFDWSAA